MPPFQGAVVGVISQADATSQRVVLAEIISDMRGVVIIVDEEALPTDQCLTPAQVAGHVCELIDGTHDHRQGEVMTYRKQDLV